MHVCLVHMWHYLFVVPIASLPIVADYCCIVCASSQPIIVHACNYV